MAAKTETEIKLLARGPISVDDVLAALAELGDGVTRGRPRTKRHTDLYLDDADQHLALRGIGLRVRKQGKHRTLCWKSRKRRKGARFARDEVEVRWRRRKRPPADAAELPADLRVRVEPFIYGHPLLPLVEIRTERTALSLAGDRASAELCIDRVTVSTPGERAVGRFDELEIELIEGDPRALDAWARELARRLPLENSRIDKLQRAMELCERTPQPGGATIGPHTPARDTCHHYLERHLTRLQEQELAVRIDASPAPVHKLRVACRRIRSGLRAFSDYLPRELVKSARVFGHSARAFGGVRDLDVLMRELIESRDEMPEALRDGADLALERLGAERDRRHRAGVRYLSKRRRLARLERFQDRLAGDWHQTMPTRTKTSTVAKQLLQKSADSVAGCSSTDDPHELRLALKRLRYTCEVFASAYGEPLTAVAGEIAALQDQLGLVNDATIAESLLSDWAPTEDSMATDATLAVGVWIGRQQQRRQRAMEAFESTWREFDFDASMNRVMKLFERRLRATK